MTDAQNKSVNLLSRNGYNTSHTYKEHPERGEQSPVIIVMEKKESPSTHIREVDEAGLINGESPNDAHI